MYDNIISCSSLSKNYSITGWRLGYLIGSKKVIENAKKVHHDFLTICAPSPLQEAACVAVNFDESYYKNLQRLYTEKRDYFCKRLDDMGFIHSKTQGTFSCLYGAIHLVSKGG
ncbi:MAG: pyridoxal phosphate-dependent aminotransferase [Lutispora sp.]|nr:pyridoxal phosphate-dependent aminotransferase [Lutispora sp.]MDD4834844.1 pyridoxal phosphate-dependent aminotransferase [Lutispora sp.]